ncbi:MAG: phosphatase PAP2 family protein, partial [Deltaproteobacteria bacterium]|nr:phosphatase PAP2 family protein [Deltaproteobacteria bacterium]
IWASIMAYSRIYLGVHYPGDILVAIIVGIGLGFLFSWLTRKVIGYQERCMRL